MAKKIYTLSRDEILRGFKSFDKVFEKNTRLRGENITAYVQKCDPPSADSAGFPVRAGFFVSKKKLKKLTSAIE